MEVEAEAFNALRKLLIGASTEAVEAAENAAASVYQQAAQAAAPRKTGQLAESVKVIEGRPNRKTLTGSMRKRLFVGPEKRKGYYGYFVEKGHRSAGPKRIVRKAKGNTHSQSGTQARTQIPAHPWFEPAIKAADAHATQSAVDAFNAKLEELNQRG